MNKEEFQRNYRCVTSKKITAFFDDATFKNDENIFLTEEKMSIDALMRYYVLRYKKHNQLDDRGIELKINDLETSLITISEAICNPEKWDLDLKKRKLPLVKDLWAIPIATDIKTEKSLVLDSNHCLVNTIKILTHINTTKIPIIRIAGSNLEKLVIDFKILNRY